MLQPIGVYGETKRQGEIAVLNSDIDAIVIRTSWLYSSYGNNFMKQCFILVMRKKILTFLIKSEPQHTPETLLKLV